jgi:hypothetical protein
LISTNYLKDVLLQLRMLKELAEKSLDQVSDTSFFHILGPESNSIAIIVKHIAGNMLSRWTDFLTSDGEKPNRFRDTEFELAANDSREVIVARWQEGWKTLLDSIESLKPDDLNRIVTIRSEPHNVIEAINRQFSHYAYHVGQIAYLARHFAGDKWQTLSIPKGKTDEFNRHMRDKF